MALGNLESLSRLPHARWLADFRKFDFLELRVPFT